MIFVVIQQPVFFHAAQFRRHGTALHCQIIRQLLPVKGNGKNSTAGILCAGGQEGQEFFPCAAAGDVSDLSGQCQIPSGEDLQQTAGEEGKKGILLPCGCQYPVQGKV